MNILVVGAGYVGLSNAVMLAMKHDVTVIDTDTKKVEQLQNKISPIKDKLLEAYLKKKELKISFESKICRSLEKVDVVLIATPTNFDNKNNHFDTNSIQTILNELHKKSFKNLVVIRSTIPIGFTDKMKKKYSYDIAFFPEFLREGKALKDSLYPSRLICGSQSNISKRFLTSLKDCTKKKKVKMLITSPSEAESIKLFSNTYLAMRIAFFNEVDSFALSKNINSKNLIDGISADPRIGDYYNNPSFGYGGYCLPKDTKQLRVNFQNIPQKLISASINSNIARKKFITNKIVESKPSKIGVYRLSMKSNSDNWRESSIIDILKDLKRKDYKIKIYEPMIEKNLFNGIRIENNFKQFTKWSDLIITNRLDTKIEKTKKIIFSRDLFNNN